MRVFEPNFGQKPWISLWSQVIWYPWCGPHPASQLRLERTDSMLIAHLFLLVLPLARDGVYSRADSCSLSSVRPWPSLVLLHPVWKQRVRWISD